MLKKSRQADTGVKLEVNERYKVFPWGIYKFTINIVIKALS